MLAQLLADRELLGSGRGLSAEELLARGHAEAVARGYEGDVDAFTRAALDYDELPEEVLHMLTGGGAPSPTC